MLYCCVLVLLVQFTGGVLSVESCNCARMKNHVSSWTWRMLPPLKSKGCFSLPDYFSDISSWADMLNDVNCCAWTWASCGLAVPMYPTCTGVSVVKCGCPCVSLLGHGTALRTLLPRQGIRACSSTRSRGELENSRRYLQHTVGKKKNLDDGGANHALVADVLEGLWWVWWGFSGLFLGFFFAYSTVSTLFKWNCKLLWPDTLGFRWDALLIMRGCWSGSCEACQLSVPAEWAVKHWQTLE